MLKTEIKGIVISVKTLQKSLFMSIRAFIAERNVYEVNEVIKAGHMNAFMESVR